MGGTLRYGAQRLATLGSIVCAALLACPVFAQPANDNPCGAVVLTPNVSCSNTAGTLASATPTPSIPAPGCANYAGGDVWYQVTVPASGQITLTTSQQGGGINTGMAFYTAPSCAGPFALVSCNDDIIFFFNQYSRLIYNGVPGTVIYVRVWRYGSTGAGSFNICATAPPPPPANNDPCGAIPIAVASNCNYTAGTNVSATNNSTYPAPGCGNFGGGSLDVWYTFTAPASGNAIIETTSGTLTDAAMALYSANACNGTFSLVQCDDDNGPGLMPFLSFTGLTPGVTYYLRFWGYGSGSGSYNICVHGPATIPAGQCVYVLQLFDSGNNGWGSSSVSISINGGPATTYTCTGTGDIFLIGVNIGNVIVVQYTNTGPTQAQNRYTLSLLTGGGQIFNSGSPPAAGVAFTQTVTCTPPPSPQSDCVGGATVCGSQSFNNNSSGTGNVADLNPSNQGCLASAERQGTWYRFSPSNGGTIGFTIAPTLTTTDYDFAVWGPMSGVQCPPSATPLRCSYSGLTGNTGVGNGAADASEGAGGDKWVSIFPAIVGQVYILYIDNFSINGQSFALSWQLGGGASLNCTVLPIVLTSFTADATEHDIDLHWATATEEDNDRFEIERSTDGGDFKLIGSVDGAGNSLHETRYIFTDQEPANGLNYYRLKQVDLDGHFEYSPVATAFHRGDKGSLLLVPNPGSTSVRVLLPHGVQGSSLVVTDATGRELRNSSVSGDELLLDASAFPLGLYSFRVLSIAGEQLAQGTWVKQ